MLMLLYDHISHSVEETNTICLTLAKQLKPNDVIALFGDLGSGKTVFIQGVCQGLGITVPVTSPTYTLVHEYSLSKHSDQRSLLVFHFDFYRLETASDFISLDLDGYFDQDAISLIEWADRGLSFLPATRFEVHLNRVYEDQKLLPDQRQIIIHGPESRKTVLT